MILIIYGLQRISKMGILPSGETFESVTKVCLETFQQQCVYFYYYLKQEIRCQLTVKTVQYARWPRQTHLLALS